MKVYYLTPGVSFTDFRSGSSIYDDVNLNSLSYQTTTAPNGHSVTTMWRALRPNKEDRIAKLEWASNGGLGRVVMGKACIFLSSLY